MSTLKAKDYNVLVEKDSDGVLVATVLELRGCHTQATSMDELFARVMEAIELCEEDEMPMLS